MQSCYRLLCGSCPSLPQGVVPTAPEQPTEEAENQVKSTTAVPDAPPDYNSHFVPGKVNQPLPEYHKQLLRSISQTSI